MTEMQERKNQRGGSGSGESLRASPGMRAPQTEAIYVPPVDIVEDAGKVRLVAEMPGVDPQSVSVTVENKVLTIEGTARADCMPEWELVGQEYGVGRYRRDFTLSDAIQAEEIRARVQHGLLEITLPKRAEVKPRKIHVEA